MTAKLNDAAKKALCLRCPLKASGFTSFSLRHGVLLTCVLTLIYLSFSFWQAKRTHSMSEPLLWIVGKLLARSTSYLSSFRFFSSDQDLTQKKVSTSYPVRLPVFVTHVRLCFSSRVSFFPLTSSLALVLSDHPRLPPSFSSSSFLLYSSW